MSTSLPPVLHDSAATAHPALYAEVVDQLSHTVQQLLLAALARARQLPPAPLPDAPGEAMPAPMRPSVTVPARGFAPSPLSARERDVLQRIAAGDSNKMIARALDLSPHTVKRHVANILDKLDLRSRGQAAAWWMTQPAPHLRDH